MFILAFVFADRIVDWVQASIWTVMAVVITSLVARDLIRDRLKTKQGRINSEVSRGPWYPRFLPFGHMFEDLGSAIQDNPGYGYKYWLARALTVLLFLAFVGLVWTIVWLFL